MQYRISFEKESRLVCSSGILIIKIFILGVLIFLSQISVQAQNTQDAQYSKPSWRFGVAGGANFNFHRGSTHQLNSDFTPPAIFHDGDGVGLYLAPLLEFHPASSIWGFMLQSGYDSRKGTFDQVETPCNCPAFTCMQDHVWPLIWTKHSHTSRVLIPTSPNKLPTPM